MNFTPSSSVDYELEEKGPYKTLILGGEPETPEIPPEEIPSSPPESPDLPDEVPEAPDEEMPESPPESPAPDVPAGPDGNFAGRLCRSLQSRELETKHLVDEYRQDSEQIWPGSAGSLCRVSV